jgi:hypothetical protein
VFAYAIWQTGVQTVIFFIWAITTFGLAHLYDLQSPLLWQAMLVYGGVISTATNNARPGLLHYSPIWWP